LPQTNPGWYSSTVVATKPQAAYLFSHQAH
jgi:hypothetical protein